MKWRSTWWLTKKELKYNRVYFFLTFIMVLFFSLITSSLLEQLAGQELGRNVFLRHFPLDAIFMVLMVSSGILFISTPYLSFRTIKEDPFSKRMALYRSLPIPLDVLSRSRMLMMIVILLVFSTVFFTVIYFGVDDGFFLLLPKSEYIPFALLWIGFTLFFNAINPVVEFGTSGKFLYIYSCFLFFLFPMLKLTFFLTVGKGIVEWSLSITLKYGWTASIISLVIGGLAIYLWHSVLKKRLLNRDYV